MITQPRSSARVTRRSVRFGMLLLSFLAGSICTGCLSKPPLRQETFAFRNPPPPKAVSLTGGIVTVHSVAVSPLFSSHSFIYRTGQEAYETDSAAAFLVAPDEAIAIAVRDRLLSSGRFQNVVDPGSRVNADKSIDVHVSELYGDFSQAGQPAAVLSMRVSAFDANNAKVHQPLLQKNYSRRIPLRENTAAAVMAGWEAGLDEIMVEVAADLTGGKTS